MLKVIYYMKNSFKLLKKLITSLLFGKSVLENPYKLKHLLDSCSNEISFKVIDINPLKKKNKTSYRSVGLPTFFIDRNANFNLKKSIELPIF